MAVPPDSLVWYVSYGSNLDPERLRIYLAGGTPDGGHHTYDGARDPARPRASRRCRIPHRLHFAGESRTWGGGVAFLDHDTVDPPPGLGHAYLLTAAQFEDVAAQETGRPSTRIAVERVRSERALTLGTGRYDRIVWLGDRDGVAQLTFTSPTPAATTMPAPPRPRYLQRIIVGLRSAHGLAPSEIATYLSAWQGIADHWSHDDLLRLASDPAAVAPE